MINIFNIAVVALILFAAHLAWVDYKREKQKQKDFEEVSKSFLEGLEMIERVKRRKQNENT